jgi:hypothetical protein
VGIDNGDQTSPPTTRIFKEVGFVVGIAKFDQAAKRAGT